MIYSLFIFKYCFVPYLYLQVTDVTRFARQARKISLDDPAWSMGLLMLGGMSRIWSVYEARDELGELAHCQ